MLFEKTSLRVFFTILIFVILFIGFLGFYALYTAPALYLDQEILLDISDSSIKRINNIFLDHTFFLRFPEFFTPYKEQKWWQKHKEVYHILNNKRLVDIEFSDGNSKKAKVSYLSLKHLFKKTGLIYLVAFIYLLSAILVFQKEKSLSGYLCSFFLLSGASYFTSATPIVNRPFTLHPLLFQILIKCLYFSAGGLITLVHFSLVFPKPKDFLKRIPYFSLVFYIYYLLTVILYFSGIIAFASAFPFLCLWIFIMTLAFLHSLFKEKDKFLKRQIRLIILALLLVSLVFVILSLLPGVLRMKPIKFTYFALLSLVLPFALPLGIENFRLYKERLEAEEKIQKEKDRLRQELHDTILNNLALISISAELGLKFLEQDFSQVKTRLNLIKDLAKFSSKQLRDFLWIVSEEDTNLENFCNYLRRYAYEFLENFGIDFKFSLVGNTKVHLSFFPVRVCLYHVFREALINVVKHSNATLVRVLISVTNDRLIFEIKDNGKGFNKEHIKPKHFGLKNMEKRVKMSGGDFVLNTAPGRGTSIRVSLPLK